VFSPNRCVDPHAFLIKQGDALTTVYRGNTLPLGVSGDAQSAYLTQIAALDKAAAPAPGTTCGLNGEPDITVTPAAKPAGGQPSP
jgi:hypothetical protein